MNIFIKNAPDIESFYDLTDSLVDCIKQYKEPKNGSMIIEYHLFCQEDNK